MYPERWGARCVWKDVITSFTFFRDMRTNADVIIVGAGLAGACAALVLSAEYDVHVLEANEPASGASGAAAGLVNPFMGRRARPVWRLRAALDAVPTLLSAADASVLFPNTGVLRPAVEPDQVESFRNAAREHPDLATWLSPDAVRERYPALAPDRGALLVPKGGAVDVGAMVRALLGAAEARGATLETAAPVLYWRETPDAAVVEVDRDEGTEELRADRVLLALGQGFPPFPELRWLGLDGVKGQTVRVRRPSHVPDSLPPMSSRGYVVPDGDTLVLGSNYDNNYDDLAPDPEETTYIQEKTSQMIPGLDQAEVLDATAGVRVKHAETNLPLLGPLPRRDRLWTFTALGSKGLLTAPLLALALPRYLQDPSELPDAVTPREE
jgi:glycine oxidase